MNPQIDFGKLVMEQTNENSKIYQTGYSEGYRIGFSEGIAEAKKIVEATFGQIIQDRTP